MTDPVEVELKLEFDPVDRGRLMSFARFAGSAAIVEHLVSTYFDTPEHDIALAGYTLRVRREGQRRIQTVKAVTAAVGLFERPEWEHPIRGNWPRFDERSGPLAAIVGTDRLGRIEPLFSTDLRRTRLCFETRDAAVEVAVDMGEVLAGGRTEPLCEVEFELRQGTPQLLFDLARALNEEVPLRLGVRSKAERGYALAAGPRPAAIKAEPILLDRDGEAGPAFRTIAQACIRQFRLNEALLFDSGEAEALHQARVALRRLRSAFSLFKPLLADDPRAALLRAELRWLAAELGAVRNIDVLIPRFEGKVRERLAAERDRSFEHVRAELDGGRTRLLMIDLAEWLALGDWQTEPMRPHRAHGQMISVASDLLEARRARLKRRGKGLSGLDREGRHKVRIEAKKLRYAAEFFASLYTGDEARQRHRHFLESLEVLQEELGRLNDLAVGPQVLAKLGIDAKLPKSGKRQRERILERADAAYRLLMHAKRFW